MRVFVLCEEKNVENPLGHVVFGWASADDQREPDRLFGYRFNLNDVPEPQRDPSKLRPFLHETAVPGTIWDETNWAALKLARIPGAILLVSWKTQVPDAVDLPEVPPSGQKPFAWYSFDPDGKPPHWQPCYNCVKWAVEQVNLVRPDSLELVRQGRMKLFVPLLRNLIGENSRIQHFED